MNQNNRKTKDPYADIIDLPHPEPQNHPRMPLENRAAQFAPFAALSGYGEAVKEEARLTEEKMELNEDVKEALDDVMRRIRYHLEKGEHPSVEVSCFIQDERKTGGRYETVFGTVRKVDTDNGFLILDDGGQIRLQDICAIKF